MKFGLIPEFIGRLPVITTVAPLDRDALVRILTEPRNALVKQYTKMFALDDVELEFDAPALEAIADQALKRGTGARGLRAIMEEVLLPVMFDVPTTRASPRSSSAGRRCSRTSCRRSSGARTSPRSGARSVPPETNGSGRPERSSPGPAAARADQDVAGLTNGMSSTSRRATSSPSV